VRRWLPPGILLLAAACARPAPVAPSPVPGPAQPEVAPPPQPVPAPAAPAPPPRLSSIAAAFTGDINLGTATLPDGLPPDSGRALLRAAASTLKGDLVVGNLEGVLADTGTSEKCIERRRGRERVKPNCYAFRTPTWLARRLKDAGFTHLNLANNHSGDLGDAGRASTAVTLDSLALRHYGPLGSIALDSIRRGDSLSVVALVGFSTYPFSYNLLDSAASRAIVDSVRQVANVVIVTFHGGAEGVNAQHVGMVPESLATEPRGELRTWAHLMIDAGADAVIGHGPHVLRGIEFYRGKPVAYSLGNFATYRGFSLQGPLGITAVLHLEFGGDGRYLGGTLVPMIQRPRMGPAPDPKRQAIPLVRRLSQEDFGSAAAIITDAGAVLPPTRAPH
ncbi:MAG TPA: CapA family protein, partial [Gemmatimonadales bacterium]|nr:CapA family protein [Gemmatimonadales bacterium]